MAKTKNITHEPCNVCQAKSILTGADGLGWCKRHWNEHILTLTGKAKTIAEKEIIEDEL